jgi:hypothetical protein
MSRGIQSRGFLRRELYSKQAATAGINLRRILILGAALAGVLVHGSVDTRHVAIGIVLPIVLTTAALIAAIEQWQRRDLAASLVHSALGACVSFTTTSSLVILFSLIQH